METPLTSALENSSESTAPTTKKWYQAKLFSVGITPTGYIAVGVAPMGVVAIGIVPMGVISIGTVAMGTIAAGFVSMGLLTFGDVSMSLFGGHKGAKPHAAPPAQTLPQEAPQSEPGHTH